MIIAVYGSARPAAGEALYEDARRLGALLAQQGHTVMTGGYCGMMEAVSRGAAEAGGSTIGVTAPAAPTPGCRLTSAPKPSISAWKCSRASPTR